MEDGKCMNMKMCAELYLATPGSFQSVKNAIASLGPIKKLSLIGKDNQLETMQFAKNMAGLRCCLKDIIDGK